MTLEIDLLEQIAWILRKPGYDLAFALHEDEISFARMPQASRAPSSAIIKLVQALQEDVRPDRRSRSRDRIFATKQPRLSDTGVVKVVGKSVTGPISPRDHDRGDDVRARWPRWTKVTSDEDSFVLTTASPGFPAVSATLEDADGQVLQTAFNANGFNKSLHAEFQLIQNWYRRTGRLLPVGATLKVSHKPCRMCASMILDFCEDPEKFHVIYDEEVSGCRSRRTPLDEMGTQRQVDGLLNENLP